RMKILLLEDDFKLSTEIRFFLTGKQIESDVVYDGSIFMKQLQTDDYDLYILDINVPGINGLEVCSQIRSLDKSTPILMLTAFGDVEDKVEAFGRGADDYLVKPFHFDELLVRIQSLMRRNTKPQKTDIIFEIEDLQINESEMKVTRCGNEIILSPKEYQLLLLLAQAKGRPVSKTTISEKVWDINFETGTNTIEVYINFIRKKIDKDFEQKLIHTRPGFGYYLKAE
ncbi:MAG: response regulator transcription factor, partial [Paludibacter sp.]